MGAGNAPQLGDLNDRFRGLARETGSNYMPLGGFSRDGITPLNPAAALGGAIGGIGKGGSDFTRQPVLAPQSLAPIGSTDNSRSVTQTNRVDISIQGGADPTATANMVANKMNDVHALSIRSAQGAIR